ncbi:MAG: two-component system sensor histidine kinase RppB [Leptolyngbyaceae bacterium]|nr:two-component system sensor histidine kinase RppB [Leptolyngbyaceae bacterium]
MSIHQLFRRSRIRLALSYSLVMAGILSLSAYAVYRLIVQANWAAMEREIESIAGTLHDSLEPMLPATGDPTVVLQQIFPDLCLAGQDCRINPTLIQRHTTGVSDRTTYYIRLFDHQGSLLAYSPNQPESLSDRLNPEPWQTLQTGAGKRYHQFTTILHGAAHAHAPDEAFHDHPSWGYLQVGRTLSTFDAERQQLRWILIGALPLALGLIAVSSWCLSGLAMQPIYRAYQQQQQFTANAAHELRSPLASLLATVEATIRLPQDQAEQIPTLLHTVERQGRRLSQLITDLLLLTSLEQDTMTHPAQPCCLNDIVADLTEELAELATVTDIDLRSQIPDTEIQVMGYESQLYRLVANLMANALQYTPSGGTVVVSLATQDRMAVITVKDTGIGIPAEAHGRIFERFYRVNGDRARQSGGTGLGLAIAEAIAHRHQGYLTLTSVLQQGSSFNVYLPILRWDTEAKTSLKT